MAFVILIECVSMTEILFRETFNKKIWISTAITNIISGIVGILLSVALNGGWWLVVWLPWVSRNEIDVSNNDELLAISIYYGLAFILTVVIEILCNWSFLKSSQSRNRIIKATLLTNIISYFIGSVFLYVYSFNA